jgi:signal transduction histidine kinase
MNEWDEMKAYVGFDDGVDGARLRRFLPFVEGRLQWVIDRFYETVLRFEGARSVLEDQAQVERLKVTLKHWCRELLAGPWDMAYYERRRRIGRVHVRIGLPHRYMFTAMNQFRGDLMEIAEECVPSEDIFALNRSLQRIADLDLAVMTQTYMGAREENELRELQQLIIQNLPVTVLCLDEDDRVTSATRPGARLFGAGGKIGAHYSHFLASALLRATDLDATLARARASGNEVTIPRVVVGEGAQERHFRVTLVPLDHALANVLLHVEELTDVVQAEQRLQRAESLARIGALAANVAHEIRNPLAAISATLQVIGGSFGVEDRRRVILGKVNDQVVRLDRLVTDLLGYSRPAEPNPRLLELAEVARQAIAESGVEAELELNEDIEVVADGQYVRQILVNLLQNARDAGDQVVIEVGPGPLVCVQDDGPGIDPAVSESLFEPFVTTKTRGTGLGLAISRKLAQSMSGELALAPSRVGARFCLSLPEPGSS